MVASCLLVSTFSVFRLCPHLCLIICHADLVGQWLQSLELAHLVPLFRANHITGAHMLAITDQQLASIGGSPHMLRNVHYALVASHRTCHVLCHTVSSIELSCFSSLVGFCLARASLLRAFFIASHHALTTAYRSLFRHHVSSTLLEFMAVVLSGSWFIINRHDDTVDISFSVFLSSLCVIGPLLYPVSLTPFSLRTSVMVCAMCGLLCSVSSSHTWMFVMIPYLMIAYCPSCTLMCYLCWALSFLQEFKTCRTVFVF